MNTKLILIEGLPGAGKSTTTVQLGKVLQQHGIACRAFQEEENPHPIPCLDYAIKELPQKMPPLWMHFVDQAMKKPLVTIIESRLWQNTAMYMYMSETDVEEILQFIQRVAQVLAPLLPVLVVLDQDNTESALRRLYTARGDEWVEQALRETIDYPWFKSRGLYDFTGWLQFFTDWQQMAERLYADWPHPKIKILNPYEDWERAYGQIIAFLQVEHPLAKEDE